LTLLIGQWRLHPSLLKKPAAIIAKGSFSVRFSQSWSIDEKAMIVKWHPKVVVIVVKPLAIVIMPL